MKTIYDSSKTSAELAGVEKEIKKALLKIYKEYTKIAGQSDSDEYLEANLRNEGKVSRSIIMD